MSAATLYVVADPTIAEHYPMTRAEVVALAAKLGRAVPVTPDRYTEDDFYESPSCSICDGLGHGYPGGGPCPLEDLGANENCPEWAR